MAAPVTTDLIWKEIAAQQFAVLGFVSPQSHARTSGIVFVVRDRQLYIGIYKNSWKAKHLARNPNVSLTVTVPKRIPFLPWIKIPAATITFQGTAELHGLGEMDPEIQRALTDGLELDSESLANYAVVKVRPRGKFLTYGVGVPLRTMRKPQEARGRAPV